MGTSGIVVTVSTDQPTVAQGQHLQITVTVRNIGQSTQTLEFSSGCQTDYEFLDSSGQVAASSEQMCTQALTSRPLAAGASFSDTHRYVRGMAGVPPLSSGTYRLRGVLLLMGGGVRSEPVTVSLP